jgi:hypothetical protein
MKRFSWHDICCQDSSDDEYFMADDAERELAKLRAVVEALPRCHEGCNGEVCMSIATRWGIDVDGYICDNPHLGKARDLPYAEALRALEKP